MKERLKRVIFGLLGKEPEAVVVSFATGAQSKQMEEEIRALVPDRRHFTVEFRPGGTWELYRALRKEFRRYRIGLAPLLLDGDPKYQALRRAAFLLAPGRILAYNTRLERHHLRLREPIASLLFLRGVPVHRIYTRPWTPLPDPEVKREIHHGRPFEDGRRRIVVATPYVPFPLSHGGAVRMYNLLREAAREFDLVLFAFTEGKDEELGPLLEFCSAVVLVPKRENTRPRWWTLAPPETVEYDSPALRRALDETCREFRPDLRQVEYTQLAGFGGDVLVEHDVTFDLYRQMFERDRTVAAWWNWRRWRRFERRAVERFARVVAMSDKDAAMLAGARTSVIPNGVDFERFRPRAEAPGARVLFIGSFRHFPNVVAFRFLAEQVWPAVRERVPEARLTVVAGPDPLVYWRQATGTLRPPEDDTIEMLGFVRDVVPLYVGANLVVVPTLVSAGTNLKVIEALAMRRAVVSTSSGCAGLGLEHGTSVWVADGAEAFAGGAARLLDDHALRGRIAENALRIAEERYDWTRLGALQRKLYRELAGSIVTVRPASESDVEAMDRIQRLAPEAVLWEPETYLSYDCMVAEVDGRVAGFIVCRNTGPTDAEVLSLIVHPALRRRGIAERLLEEAMRGSRKTWYLEVRESNWPARQLYRKHGFEDVSRRPNYYQDNGETAVVMRRE